MKIEIGVFLLILFVNIVLYFAGSSFLCSVLIAPVRNEEGIAVMYIVNHEDVTWSPNKDEVTLPSMTQILIVALVVWGVRGGVGG